MIVSSCPTGVHVSYEQEPTSMPIASAVWVEVDLLLGTRAVLLHFSARGKCGFTLVRVVHIRLRLAVRMSSSFRKVAAAIAFGFVASSMHIALVTSRMRHSLSGGLTQRFRYVNLSALPSCFHACSPYLRSDQCRQQS